jgi:hypothetical protein
LLPVLQLLKPLKPHLQQEPTVEPLLPIRQFQG